jgi:hypothetical protein
MEKLVSWRWHADLAARFSSFSTCLKLGLHLIVPKGWREQFSDNPEQKTSIVIFRWIYRFAALAE